MSLILCMRTNKANNSKAFKVTKFNNENNWIVHGTPVYTKDIHPDDWNDSFYLDNSTWLESPANNIFNLYQKSFTISWWEYNLGTTSTEAGAINFATGNLFNTNNYLLLNYLVPSTIYGHCYARNSTANNTGWTIFSGMSTGGETPKNTWINFAFTSKYENGTHIFTTYKNGIKQVSSTSSLTFPNVSNDGKMLVGNYTGSTTRYGGPNKYYQNIKMYDECIFDRNYNVKEYEFYGEPYRVLNNIKTE